MLSPDTPAEWLYWVGCTGALVERNIQVTVAMSRVLKAAGVDFGILGAAEGCCGDPARRMGHELQFQLMARQNIEVLKALGVKKIVTHCPHCLQSLKVEYPALGGNFEVFHHTELIRHLLGESKIFFADHGERAVVYHDSCYLGRYRGIYDPPREILRRVPGLRIMEMERSRGRSFWKVSREPCATWKFGDIPGGGRNSQGRGGRKDGG